MLRTLASLILIVVIQHVVSQYQQCNCPEENCYCVDRMMCNLNNMQIYTHIKNFRGLDDNKVDYCPNGMICCKKYSKEEKCGRHKKTQDRGPIKMIRFRSEHPWLVAILLKNENGYKFRCWGSLVHPQAVLTATHCLKTITSTNLIDEVKVISGVLTTKDLTVTSNNQQSILAKEIIQHSPYQPMLFNDVSLVVLQQAFALREDTSVLCLPPKSISIIQGERCVAVGWKSVGVGDMKKTQSVKIPLLNRQNCEQKLKRTDLGEDFSLHKSFICAGGERGVDTCIGDGGTPLVCNYDEDNAYQIGISAWGVSCGVHDVPSCYVNVPLFVDWIKDQLKHLDAIQFHNLDIEPRSDVDS